MCVCVSSRAVQAPVIVRIQHVFFILAWGVYGEVHSRIATMVPVSHDCHTGHQTRRTFSASAFIKHRPVTENGIIVIPKYLETLYAVLF